MRKLNINRRTGWIIYRTCSYKKMKKKKKKRKKR